MLKEDDVEMLTVCPGCMQGDFSNTGQHKLGLSDLTLCNFCFQTDTQYTAGVAENIKNL